MPRLLETIPTKIMLLRLEIYNRLSASMYELMTNVRGVHSYNDKMAVNRALKAAGDQEWEIEHFFVDEYKATMRAFQIVVLSAGEIEVDFTKLQTLMHFVHDTRPDYQHVDGEQFRCGNQEEVDKVFNALGELQLEASKLLKSARDKLAIKAY